MTRSDLAVHWFGTQTQGLRIVAPRSTQTRVPQTTTRLLLLSVALGVTAACDSTTDPFDGPDARPIVFFRLDGVTGWELARIAPAGGTPVRLDLPMRGTLFPSVSPNGQRLAFVVESDPAGVYVANADGSNAVRVFHQWTDRITWSPDATRIAITSGGEIIVIPLTGGSPYSITDDVFVDAGYPSWSTQDRITFQREDGVCSIARCDNRYDILVVPSGGGDARNLTMGTDQGGVRPTW